MVVPWKSGSKSHFSGTCPIVQPVDVIVKIIFDFLWNDGFAFKHFQGLFGPFLISVFHEPLVIHDFDDTVVSASAHYRPFGKVIHDCCHVLGYQFLFELFTCKANFHSAEVRNGFDDCTFAVLLLVQLVGGFMQFFIVLVGNAQSFDDVCCRDFPIALKGTYWNRFHVFNDAA